MAKGAPANKLVLGMGSYGRGWLLDDQAINGFYAPANALIDAGPYTREPGIWGYNEVLEKVKGEEGWNVVRDPDVVGPYAVKGRQWIGYDDEISIGERVSRIEMF
jgi:chitinase